MEIIHSLTIDASPARVLNALTSQAGLAGWWTTDTTAEPHVGGINRHRFGDLGSLTMRVDALSADRVVWSAIEAPPEEWKSAPIAFSLTPDDDGGTNLEFRQGPFPENYPAFGMFNYNWALYMRSLKLYVERGIGEPFGSEALANAR